MNVLHDCQKISYESYEFYCCSQRTNDGLYHHNLIHNGPNLPPLQYNVSASFSLKYKHIAENQKLQLFSVITSPPN